MIISTRIGRWLIIGAGLMLITSSVGYTVVGIPGVMEHFGSSVNDYWQRRLYASQLLGTTAFAYTGLVTLIGAWMRTAFPAPGMRKARAVLLSASILPSAASVMQLLLLTPEDAPHSIPFALAALAIVIGLLLDRAPSGVNQRSDA